MQQHPIPRLAHNPAGRPQHMPGNDFLPNECTQEKKHTAIFEVMYAMEISAIYHIVREES